MVLFGNIDPIDVMLNMSPEEVGTRTLGLLAKVREEPYFILSTGCDLSAETPIANVAAFMAAGLTPKKEWANLVVDGADIAIPKSRDAQDLDAGLLLPAADTPLLQNIRDAAAHLNKDQCLDDCRQALEADEEPETIIQQGLAAGKKDAGAFFEKHAYFVPELITAAGRFSITASAPAARSSPGWFRR